MAHDRRILKHEEQIEALKPQVPAWIRNLKRPMTPAIVPTFGPLEGIRVVGTGIIVAQPYIGTKLAEFGAEVMHVERPGGDPYRGMAPGEWPPLRHAASARVGSGAAMAGTVTTGHPRLSHCWSSQSVQS